MLHKHRFDFSVVLEKEVKLVESINKIRARIVAAAHRQPLLVSFFPFLRLLLCM